MFMVLLRAMQALRVLERIGRRPPLTSLDDRGIAKRANAYQKNEAGLTATNASLATFNRRIKLRDNNGVVIDCLLRGGKLTLKRTYW